MHDFKGDRSRFRTMAPVYWNTCLQIKYTVWRARGSSRRCTHIYIDRYRDLDISLER